MQEHVRMTFDHSGQQRLVRQIDRARIGRRGNIGADRGNLVAADQDRPTSVHFLSVENRGGFQKNWRFGVGEGGEEKREAKNLLHFFSATISRNIGVVNHDSGSALAS